LTGTLKPSVTVPVACIGFFMVVLDTTAVNVALPSIDRDLGGGVSGQQWVVDGYTLLFGALVLSAGAMSDRIGARRAFGWGLALFALSSVACGVAPSLGLLIAGRVLQGAAAALMLPSSLALVGQAHADPRAHARAVSIWAAAGGAAVAAGPIVGGLATDMIGWRAVFFVNVPIAALGLAALTLIPDSPTRPAPLDVIGQVTAALALAGLTFGLIEGGRLGYDDSLVQAAFVVFVVSTLLFVVAELRLPEPAVPLRLLSGRAATGTIFVGAAISFSIYGAIFTLSLYFQDVLGHSPVVTGFMFIPMTAVMPIATMATNTWRHGTDVWVPLTVGLALMVPGVLGLAFIDADTPTWQIALCTLPFGAGSGIAGPSVFVAIMASLPPERAGIASGVANANRQMAATLGVAIFGALLARESDLVPGMQVAFLVAAAALALGLVLSVAWVRPRGTLPARDGPSTSRGTRRRPAASRR
jgi:DHA2 family methylenomycin A resistance protein-like MFS transporter